MAQGAMQGPSRTRGLPSGPCFRFPFSSRAYCHRITASDAYARCRPLHTRHKHWQPSHTFKQQAVQWIHGRAPLCEELFLLVLIECVHCKLVCADGDGVGQPEHARLRSNTTA